MNKPLPRPHAGYIKEPPRRGTIAVDPCDPNSPRIAVVEIDAGVVADLHEHYRIAGVKPVNKPNR